MAHDFDVVDDAVTQITEFRRSKRVDDPRGRRVRESKTHGRLARCSAMKAAIMSTHSGMHDEAMSG
jgi:hypothetical protein